MKIPANSLEAFLAVARSNRFHVAATTLGISQSALSQRILNLEDLLEITLFVRERSGSRLTQEGQSLLRYAQAQESLETDYLQSRAGPSGMGGSLRVGGFSSITRSILAPALAPLVREHSVGLSLFSRELGVLPDLLRKGEADLIVLDHELEREGVVAAFLGFEENTLVRGSRWKTESEVYLDHDAEDLTTHRYFQKFGPRGKMLERRYLDDVYGLIEGVKLGLGSAVLPLHLVGQDPELEILDPDKVFKSPVWLHYPAQGYYPRLQVLGREEIMAYAKHRLAQK